MDLRGQVLQSCGPNHVKHQDMVESLRAIRRKLRPGRRKIQHSPMSFTTLFLQIPEKSKGW